MPQIAWTRLIRFEAADGRILRGEPILPGETAGDFDIGRISQADNLQAQVVIGDDIFDTTGKTVVTNEVVPVKRLLGPLLPSDVPIIRCVGLNYAKHSKYTAYDDDLSPD